MIIINSDRIKIELKVISKTITRFILYNLIVSFEAIYNYIFVLK
jgi:hypothetical protein